MKLSKEQWKVGGKLKPTELIGCLIFVLYLILIPITFIGTVIVFIMDLLGY